MNERKVKQPRLQKSRPRRTDWAGGDGAKYLSYAEAWARIRLAIKQGFFLEAVTVEESIISDRLTSYLVKNCEFDPANRGLRTLQNLAGLWAKTVRAQAKTSSRLLEQLDELQQGIEEWRIARNDVVHGLVKSRAGRGDDHIQGFLWRAHQAAKEGQVLARSVSNWVDAARKEIAEASKAKGGGS
jgi:hypothetical protein